MKLIDTHMHIGGTAVGFDMPSSMIEGLLGQYSIDYAIISNADAVEVSHNQELIPEVQQITQEAALQDVLDLAQRHSNKIGAAVWVKPRLQGLTSELETLIKNHLNQIVAIKLHPFHSNIAPTDSRVLPYLELAAHYHLPVISHTGGCEAARAYHLYEAAKMFPSIPFVMVHMDLGTDHKEALDLLGRLDNLYGDTTWVDMQTTIEAIKRYGSHKMLFGSDAPIDGLHTYSYNKKGERSLYQDYFDVLPEKIDTSAYEDLMYRNAMRLFHINI